MGGYSCVWLCTFESNFETEGILFSSCCWIRLCWFLDLSLLPRPFQIGVANQPGWLVEVDRTLDVPARNEADGAPAGAETR